MTISDPTITERLVAGTFFQAHLWSMAAGYIAAILLLLRKQWQRRLQPLAATGRMALTNYLMQLMLALPIAAAFQLYDRFTPGLSLALALGLFSLVQVPLSVLWLRHFDFGPFEALWRRLTYDKRRPTAPKAMQAWRRSSEVTPQQNLAADPILVPSPLRPGRGIDRSRGVT